MKVGPAVRQDQLDHAGHDEKSKGAETGRQPDHQKNGEHDLGGRGNRRQQLRRREIVGLAEDVQLEFLLEQKAGRRRKDQDVIPFSQSGSEERHGQRDAQNWLCDDNGDPREQSDQRTKALPGACRGGDECAHVMQPFMSNLMGLRQIRNR